MIDVMTRTKIHHLAQGGVLQAEIAVQCGVGLRSVERILAELEEFAHDTPWVSLQTQPIEKKSDHD